MTSLLVKMGNLLKTFEDRKTRSVVVLLHDRDSVVCDTILQNKQVRSS
jgi:hypothetical protein